MDALLRVKILLRRHELPDLKLVWGVPRRPGYTIADLLTTINEVAPMESGEWGLEDYALEIISAGGEGFECLHYQVASDVLRDEDRLLIRPLLSVDLRRRRLNGRHQLSVGGKHLVDGMAFGRPWLRRPNDRPEITIPPRKRQRALFPEPEEGSQDKHLKLDSYSDEAVESGPDRRLVRFSCASPTRDKSSGLDADNLNTDLNQSRAEPSKAETHGPSERNDGGIQIVGSGSDSDADEDFILSDNTDDASSSGDDFSLDDTSSLDELAGIDKCVPLTQAEVFKQDIYDVDGLQGVYSPESRRNGTPHQKPPLESDKLEVDPAVHDMLKVVICEIFPTVPSSTCESVLQKHGMKIQDIYHELNRNFPSQFRRDIALMRMSIALSGISQVRRHSGTARGQNAEPFLEPIKVKAINQFQPKLSDARSKKHPIIRGGKREVSTISCRCYVYGGQESSHTCQTCQAATSLTTGNQENLEGENPEEVQAEHGAVITIGVISTVSRSMRTDSHIPQSGTDDKSYDKSSLNELESNATPRSILKPVDLSARNISRNTQSVPGVTSDANGSSDESTLVTGYVTDRHSGSKLVQECEARSSPGRRNIITTGPSQQVHEPPKLSSIIRNEPGLPIVTQCEPSSEVSGPRSKSQKRNLRRRIFKRQNGDGQVVAQSISQQGKPQTAKPPILGEHLQKILSNGVLPFTLDVSEAVDGVRRPAFFTKKPDKSNKGSLGHPDAVQRQDTISISSGVDGSANRAVQTRAADHSPQDDRWERKINYQAVECCQDGLRLCPAPFPFVQRWSQEGNRSKKRKRLVTDDAQRLDLADSTASIDPDSEEQRQTKVDVVNDLPPLPSSQSTLPCLGTGDAKVGMVIVWDHWLLSNATDWQPQILSITARIVEVLDDGALLHVVLAKRDWHFFQNERIYDSATGEQVYHPLDLPLDSMERGEVEEPFTGHQVLKYSELIQPRILQEAVPPAAINIQEMNGSRDA